MTSAFAVLLVLSLTPGVALAQAEHQHETEGKMEHMKKMEEMKSEMAARKANTERLSALTTQLKDSRGDAKVNAMADIITLLVAERAAMQDHCAAMKAKITEK
jgi:hypothetical protein